MAATSTRRCRLTGRDLPGGDPLADVCVMVGRCRHTDGPWHGRIHHRRGPRRNRLAGHDDLPDHEGVRRAGVIVCPHPVKRDGRGLTTLEDTGVPAAGVGAGGIVRLVAAVGEGDLGASLDRDA